MFSQKTLPIAGIIGEGLYICIVEICVKAVTGKRLCTSLLSRSVLKGLQGRDSVHLYFKICVKAVTGKGLYTSILEGLC